MIILRDKLFVIDDPYSPRKKPIKKNKRQTSYYLDDEDRADNLGTTHITKDDVDDAKDVLDKVKENPDKEREIIEQAVDDKIKRSATLTRCGRADIAVTLKKAIHEVKVGNR